MPIFDYKCKECGKVSEHIAMPHENTIPCSCGGTSEKIFTCGSCYTGNEDATWLKSVTDVINKDTENPSAKEFLKNPNRSNYKAWMKSEGLRPLENNEPLKPPPTDMGRIRREVWENHQRRNRIEI